MEKGPLLELPAALESAKATTQEKQSSVNIVISGFDESCEWAEQQYKESSGENIPIIKRKHNDGTTETIKREVSDKVSSSEIKLLRDMFEKCLQVYMTESEVQTALHLESSVPEAFVGYIWRKLEEYNQEFFKVYALRLKMKEQITAFNYLVSQQAQVMQKAGMFNLTARSNTANPLHLTGASSTTNSAGNASAVQPGLFSSLATTGIPQNRPPTFQQIQQIQQMQQQQKLLASLQQQQKAHVPGTKDSIPSGGGLLTSAASPTLSRQVPPVPSMTSSAPIKGSALSPTKATATTTTKPTTTTTKSQPPLGTTTTNSGPSMVIPPSAMTNQSMAFAPAISVPPSSSHSTVVNPTNVVTTSSSSSSGAAAKKSKGGTTKAKQTKATAKKGSSTSSSSSSKGSKASASQPIQIHMQPFHLPPLNLQSTTPIPIQNTPLGNTSPISTIPTTTPSFSFAPAQQLEAANAAASSKSNAVNTELDTNLFFET